MGTGRGVGRSSWACVPDIPVNPISPAKSNRRGSMEVVTYYGVKSGGLGIVYKRSRWVLPFGTSQLRSDFLPKPSQRVDQRNRYDSESLTAAGGEKPEVNREIS